jgi:hypothetical protein
MDRTKFLELCKSVAMLPSGTMGIKKPPPEMWLKFDGVAFYPVGYKLSFDKYGKPRHTAILHDLKTHSILECDLLKVTE